MLSDDLIVAARAAQELEEENRRLRLANRRLSARVKQLERERQLDPQGPWALLGVGPGATSQEIQVAFRERARSRHPDHGGDAETFQRLVSARDILLNVAP